MIMEPSPIIISLGNQCAPALASRALGHHTYTFPFDWVPTNPMVIFDCLNTNFDKYVTLGSPCALGDMNDDLILFQQTDNRSFPINYINTYNCWFCHDRDKPSHILSETLSRRAERLISTITSGEKILFVFSNEPSIYYKTFRDKEDLYYEYIVNLQNILIEKYKCDNFKILCIFINRVFPDTPHIKCINMKWLGPTSNNGEAHISKTYEPFRNNVKNILRDYLSTV